MTLNEYQEAAMKTAKPQTLTTAAYMILGLNGEAGEIANKFKKILRGDEIVDPYGDIAKEAGDVLWYLAGLAEVLGVNLEDIAQNNLDKLADRKRRGAIEGFGDDR